MGYAILLILAYAVGLMTALIYSHFKTTPPKENLDGKICERLYFKEPTDNE